MPRTINLSDPTTATEGASVHITRIGGALRVEIFVPGDPDGALTVDASALPAGAQTTIGNLLTAAVTYFKNVRGYV